MTSQIGKLTHTPDCYMLQHMVLGIIQYKFTILRRVCQGPLSSGVVASLHSSNTFCYYTGVTQSQERQKGNQLTTRNHSYTPYRSGPLSCDGGLPQDL